LTLAVSPLCWSQATRAEVYSLNTLFLALLTLFALLWCQEQQQKYSIAFALTLGLSLAHHRTTLLLIPAFVALFADQLRQIQLNPHFVKRSLFYLVLAAIPLLLYLYIPLRAGATPYAVLDLSPANPIVIFENSPGGWLQVMLGTGFSGEFAVNAASIVDVSKLPNQLWAELNPVGALLTILGLTLLFIKRRVAVATFLLLGILTFVLFNSVYRIGDIADYFTPVYFFAAIALSFALSWLLGVAGHVSNQSAVLIKAITLAVLVIILPLVNLLNNFPVRDLSGATEASRMWSHVLSQDLPQNAIILSNDRDEVTPLYYYQLVEGHKPEWLGIFPKIAPGAHYANVVSVVESVAPSARPIYSLKPIPALSLRYDTHNVAKGIWQVDTAPLAPPQFPSDSTFGDTLRVHGYSLDAETPAAGAKLHLSVQYESLLQLAQDYTTSLQMFDSNGEKVAQGNDHVPGLGEFPPTAWGAGQLIRDQFELQLPPSLAPGTYELMLRFYDPESGQDLGELTPIGKIQIGP
jgi:hypothetical protein